MNSSPLIIDDVKPEQPAKVFLGDVPVEHINFDKSDIINIDDAEIERINMDDIPTEYIDAGNVQYARYKKRIGHPKSPKKKAKSKIAKASRRINRN